MKYLRENHSTMKLYHGSENELEIGTILKSHKDSYTF
jgi:hypothetical protein